MQEYTCNTPLYCIVYDKKKRKRKKEKNMSPQVGSVTGVDGYISRGDTSLSKQQTRRIHQEHAQYTQNTCGGVYSIEYSVLSCILGVF